jgi:AraC-like DNA-binding protein
MLLPSNSKVSREGNMVSNRCYYAANISRPSLGNKTSNKQPVKVCWLPDFDGLQLEKSQSLPPPQGLPIFVIPGYSVQVAFSGHANLYYGKTQQVVKITQPTVLLQNPGETWTFEPLDDTPIVVRNFEIPAEVFNDFSGIDVPFRFPNLLVTDSTVNHHLVRLTLQAFASFEAPTSRLEKEVFLAQLFKESFRHCADTRVEEHEAGSEHRAIRLVKELLHTSPEKDISLSELAALTQINKHYLLTIFKREVGMSPHSYQTNLRVCKAERLLSKGLAVAQVALEAGFSDQSHLTNVFKKYRYVTPGQFRRDSLQAVSL